MPRILFLDAYDSFSNNIVSLLTDVLEDVRVDILPIDTPRLRAGCTPDFHQDLRRLVAHYDAVVCGPGPGAPDCDDDVGLMKHIWNLDGDDVVPVLGICLGFQSLVVHMGGIVRRLSTGLHGMIRDIDHVENVLSLDEGNIFAGVPAFKATLYHSLFADIGQQQQEEFVSQEEWARRRWESPAHLEHVVPLAWVTERREGFDERILMGVKHRQRPFWGLQYHPESVCTESTGHQVIKNWFVEALRWNEAAGRTTTTEEMDASLRGWTCNLPKVQTSAPFTKAVATMESLWNSALDRKYFSKTIRLPHHVEVPDIVESLQAGRRDFVVLDSASAKTARTCLDVRGRYSIIGLDVDDALQLEYRASSGHVTLRQKGCATEIIQFGAEQTIWKVLASFWLRRKHAGDAAAETTHPFIGGFMGFTTYELGLEGIDVQTSRSQTSNQDRPDLSFAWVTRSAVIDHMEGTICLQTLSPSSKTAEEWLFHSTEALTASQVWTDGLGADFTRKNNHLAIHNRNMSAEQPTPPLTPETRPPRTNIQVPDAEDYESKVRKCQDYIAAGDSYELCLTDQTSITRPREDPNAVLTPTLTDNTKTPSPSSSSWSLYRALRSRNPAPFGSYIRLSSATLVSSSPERFLEFSGETGICSMRPMKGTVKKSAAVYSLKQAEDILHVPKEEAENLMIVDLVRHDLHAVCGSGEEAVRVPSLLKVEEYASVFQMISVVEGQLPGFSGKAGGGDGIGKEEGEEEVTGLDVLAASLPPGSMTGAPKKRSCEILQGIESCAERSLYSGVVGYMDVRGFGDWSVTIRSLFRWDDEVVVVSAPGTQQEEEMEVWHIGAGGAVTALSTAEGERDEMFTKLKGPLGVFEDQI